MCLITGHYILKGLKIKAKPAHPQVLNCLPSSIWAYARVPQFGLLLESSWEFSKLPVPSPHLSAVISESLGRDPGISICFKASQAIPVCKPSWDHCCVSCPPEAQVVPGCWAIKIQQPPASHHRLGSGIPGSAVHPQRVNPASITILVMGWKPWAEWWISLCLLFLICKMRIKPSLGSSWELIM